MPIVYSAAERFDASSGDSWSRYINWSGLTQLREVISLDGCLCPSIFQELVDEDWKYNVHEDFKLHLFLDLDYVLRRVKGTERVNVLALIENPTSQDVATLSVPSFAFRGFDLVDVQGTISALVNCGGFPAAFSNSELSECGLMTDYQRAKDVQQALREHYPSEPHAMCNLWAVWQMVSDPAFPA